MIWFKGFYLVMWNLDPSIKVRKHPVFHPVTFLLWKLDTEIRSYQFGVLRCHAVGVLDQSLKLVVLGEGDDLQHGAELRENLQREGAGSETTPKHKNRVLIIWGTNKRDLFAYPFKRRRWNSLSSHYSVCAAEDETNRSCWQIFLSNTMRKGENTNAAASWNIHSRKSGWCCLRDYITVHSQVFMWSLE